MGMVSGRGSMRGAASLARPAATAAAARLQEAASRLSEGDPKEGQGWRVVVGEGAWGRGCMRRDEGTTPRYLPHPAAGQQQWCSASEQGGRNGLGSLLGGLT
jgi:hypothetical protein